MANKDSPIEIVKHSGERVDFSIDILKASLRRSGASEDLITEIAARVQGELYPGISTKEIYNRAFALLKKQKTAVASKYKLKKAIYQLGPTGFPFEKFVSAIFSYEGYQVKTGQIMQGKCVTHEVDVVAKKDDEFIVAECKFHMDQGINCNVKVPLYINSRYRDIQDFFRDSNPDNIPNQGLVITNTRFTNDALDYGKCAGLHLLSWDYPFGNGLRDRIDRLGLYPVTVSTILTNREKQFLLSRDVVLCRQLINDDFYLDHLGISENRKKRILKEIHLLCNGQNN
ncbi:ATPase [Aequorivita sp. H23M31]|uniref:ATPase n=1 Tax=Aequorivita ciconiae TaxID=2494375 RepID=A0A410FZT2_9FLAO|nr:ATP cone domain-containing protein [Aequorivita sp. H23M31]QAA80524.1 ATPase [Aequorivita sp. H23M31]